MEHIRYTNFIRNKYFNTYCKIIEKAQKENRIYDGSKHENHHSLPSSLGGTETVILTFKEHYICHWLLTKFTYGKDRHKMIFAMSFFYYYKIQPHAKRPLNATKSRSYSNFKAIFVEMRKEQMSDPTKNPFYKDDIFIFRNMKTKETFEYTRYDAAKNTSLEANEVSRLIYRGDRDAMHTTSKGWDIWSEKAQKFSGDIKMVYIGKKKKDMLCQHCKNMFDLGNYNRWHGDNCKSKTSSFDFFQ